MFKLFLFILYNKDMYTNINAYHFLLKWNQVWVCIWVERKSPKYIGNMCSTVDFELKQFQVPEYPSIALPLCIREKFINILS